MSIEITRKRALRSASALLAVALILPPCLARAQGVAERVGGALDSAGRGIKRGVQGAFSRVRTTVHDQDVLSRLYSRIHWDKSLVGSTLELEVQPGGIAVLKGSVPDIAARQHAVMLARDTVGVLQVLDELTVLTPATQVIPATINPTAPAPVIKP